MERKKGRWRRKEGDGEEKMEGERERKRGSEKERKIESERERKGWRRKGSVLYIWVRKCSLARSVPSWYVFGSLHIKCSDTLVMIRIAYTHTLIYIIGDFEIYIFLRQGRII